MIKNYTEFQKLVIDNLWEAETNYLLKKGDYIEIINPGYYSSLLIVTKVNKDNIVAKFKDGQKEFCFPKVYTNSKEFQPLPNIQFRVIYYRVLIRMPD